MKTAEDIVKNKKSGLITVPHHATLYDAIQEMVNRGIGAILVKKNNEIVGIWTERDLLANTLSENLELKQAKISDHMTSPLYSTPHNANLYQLMDLFLGRKIRHLPVEKQGTIFGLLSIGDVMQALLAEKDRELKELNAIASWEYYEKGLREKRKSHPSGR